MEKNHPFPDLRVRKYTYNPDPEIQFLEKDSDTGKEVLRKLPASLYYQQFPLVKDEVKLQEYIDAGIPLRQVSVRLYDSFDSCDSPITQEEIYERFEQLLNEARMLRDDTSTKTIKE